jgi:hypothetical protein
MIGASTLYRSNKLSATLIDLVGGKIHASFPPQNSAQSNRNASMALHPGLYNLDTKFSAVRCMSDPNRSTPGET